MKVSKGLVEIAGDLLLTLERHLAPGELSDATDLIIHVRKGGTAYIKHGRSMYVSLGMEGVERYLQVAQGVGRLTRYVDGHVVDEYPRRPLFYDASR